MIYRTSTRMRWATRLVFAGLLTVFSGIAYADSEGLQEFYIKTVHIDGTTSIHGDESHKPETFPLKKIPVGGGLVLTEPNNSGKWKMRAFTFLPSQITVHAGDRVRLNFVGVQGMKHTVHVEGEGVNEEFQITRGSVRAIAFTAGNPGTVNIDCYDHKPSMTAQVLILPKS